MSRTLGCFKFLAVAWFLLVISSVAAGAPADLPFEERLPIVDRWAMLPDQFTLSGTVVDNHQAPLADVAIAVNGRLAARSDRHGKFALPEPVSPETVLHFSAPDVAVQRKPAGFWYGGQGGPVTVELTRLDIIFEIRPEGGIYSSGGITLDVPEGAVAESTVVRAARLPMALGYEDSSDIQLQRLGVVEFSPAGLTFQKPVQISIDLSYPASTATGELLLLDRDQQRFLTESRQVSIKDGKAVFSVAHFSRRAVGDPSKGLVKKHLERSNDINGDGKLTSEDADFVILLSGGTQSADFTITTSEATTVSKASSTTKSKGSSSSASVGGGVEFAGAGMDVSHTVSKEKSSDVTKKAGLEKSTSSSSSTTSRLQANEYELHCKYYTGIYDFYLIEEWELHKPNDWEQEALEEAYANRSNKSANWSYFTWDRSDSIALNKTMYGHTRLAVRSTDSGIQVYRMVDAYIVKKRFATYPVDCKAGNMQRRIDKATKGTEGPGEAASAMKDKFSFFGGGDQKTGYKGWGLLGESEVDFRIGQECGNESEGEYEFSTSVDESEGEEKSDSETNSEQTDAKVSGGAAVGPVKLSVEISGSSGSSSGKATAKSYAKNLMSSSSTKVHWHIINAHGHHYSDHMVAPLHSVKEVNGETIKRPLGLMILRYREYPCTTYTTTGTPSTTPPPSPPTPEPAETQPTQAGRTTTPASPARPAEPTAPPPTRPTEPSSEEKTGIPDDEGATDNIPEQINIRFSELTGTLLINRSMVGQPRGIEVVGVAPDLKEEDLMSASATAESIKITIHKDMPDSAILLKGDVKSVLITATNETEKEEQPDDSKIWPIAGALAVTGGLLETTFKVPEKLVDTGKGPQGYKVELGETPLTPLAIKGNEIAVIGTGVQAPESGEQTVKITSPSGNSSTNTVAIWSYEILPQPAAHINQWAPISMQCTGFRGNIRVTFTPGPGQTIEPTEQILPCESLKAPTPIARYMTTRIGDQPLNTSVMKVE